MNEVNNTLFIPLYGKSYVSKKNIILNDPKAEEIWESEAFPIRGKSKSKWLAYNMAMRARVFDDWTEKMLESGDGIVLHIGCGLDSRCLRVKKKPSLWLDCDFEEVIEIRRRYYEETEHYRMRALDASDSEAVRTLPECDTAVVVLEGISMYLSEEELHSLFLALSKKYPCLHILMDVYTVFGAKASKFKNPVNEVGVTELYGYDDLEPLIRGTGLRIVQEHRFTREDLIRELSAQEQKIFRLLFTGKMYRRIYRLYEFEK